MTKASKVSDVVAPYSVEKLTALATKASWPSVGLAECCEVIQGQSPPGSTYNSEGRGLPFFQGKAEFGDLYPTVKKWCTAPAKVAEPDDVLISIRAPVGPTNLCPTRAAIGRGLAALRCGQDVLPRYLLYAMRGSAHQLMNQATGSTFDAISGKQLREHKIPFAPIKEQRQIVAEIEEQFSHLEAGVAALKRAQANLKRYCGSVLHAAYRGMLSSGISKDQRQDADLPEGWTWSNLGERFRVEVGATPSRKEPTYWNGDVPWVSSGEVQFGRVRSTAESITQTGLANSSTRINPAGSVLLGMIGQGRTRGQAAILEIDAANNQNCAAIWVSQTGTPPEYVFYWLMSRYEDTRREGSGNNQQALNKTLVQQIPIPMAPVEEQHRIVAEIERRLSVVEELKAQLRSDFARAAQLSNSILQKAF